MKNEQIERLKDATKSHLKDKKFVYRPRKAKMDGKGRNAKPLKDEEGNIIYLNDYHPPTPAKQILLSLAFNMAYENYRNIRKPFTKVKPIQDIADMSDMLIRYFNNKYYANIEDIHQSNLITAEQDYKYEAIDNFRKIEYTLYGTVERLRNYYSHYVHEPGILSFKDLFQNETEMLTQDDFDEAKNWFQKRFDDVHRHLLTSLNNRKQKIIAEKEEQIKKFTNEKKIKKISKSYDKKIKQIDGVIKRFATLTLLDENNNLSIDGQLFIATMFLYKRQAKIILDKWRGLKDVEGYQNTLHTFFTYYSLQEKYSINNYDDNLLKFRNITSKLSTLPYSNNPQLRFIYNIIDKQNQKVYKELDRLPAGLKQKIEQLTNKLKNNKFSKYEKPHKVREKLEKAKKNKAKRDELNKMLIPVRKRNVYTQTLLQYLLDDDVIKNSDKNNYQIKIAIVKTATDRLKYIKENTDFDETVSLTAIKDMIKNENDEKNRQVLLNHLKELKRSFVFVTPEELKERQKPAKAVDEEGNEYIKPPEGFSFYINKNNAMIQIETSNNVSNIIIPPDLLMKWVVVYIEKKKNVWDDIYKFINGRIQKFQNVNSAKLVELYQKQYKDISLNKLLPVSIRQASKTKQLADNYLKHKTIDYINTRIKDLINFLEENQQKAKPWKYASKRKIDVILHYLHYKLLYDVYINRIDLEEYNMPEDYIRHKFFNMNTYGIARQYFRYFGRYENNTIDEVEQKAKEFVSKTAVEQLKEDYKHLFDYIAQGIKYSKSLEDIFQWVADRQIRDLKENIHSFDQHDFSHWMKVFKINDISTPEHVDKLLDNFYVRSFALPADIISLKKIFKEEWQQYKTKKEAELQERKKTASNLKDKSYTFNYTDYAFIRDYLSNIDPPNTNIDYIFKVILNNKKQKPTVYRHLLKLKTEELVMWNIAKTYWKKANGKDYLASQLKGNEKSKYFMDYCSFNKVYNHDLTYKITIDEKFWHQKNIHKFRDSYNLLPENDKTISFTIKVPARKYDNKLLSVETELIKEYVLWHHLKTLLDTDKLPEKYRHKEFRGRFFNLNNYEDLMKMVHKELIQSVTDIFQVLRAEKRIVDSDINYFMQLLENKYKDVSPITDFYLTITDKKDKPYDSKLFEEILKKANETTREAIKDYMINYRNYALHYQLQDPVRKKWILDFLNLINEGILDGEFYTNT